MFRLILIIQRIQEQRYISHEQSDRYSQQDNTKKFTDNINATFTK